MRARAGCSCALSIQRLSPQTGKVRPITFAVFAYSSLVAEDYRQMIFRCPVCNRDFDSAALRMEWGPGGGFRCPLCNEPVRVAQPYRAGIAVVSLLIVSGTLTLIGVRTIVTFVILTAVLWVPVSLFLNMAASRIKAPRLQPGRSGSDPLAYQLFRRGTDKKEQN